MNFRTDLAMEAVQLLKQTDSGIKQHKKNVGDLEITQVTIETDAAAQKLGKLKGKYITIELPAFTDNFQNIDDKIEVISKQIRYLLPSEGLIFVVGLGNEAITPDALGPKTIKSILATRHITGEIARSTGLDALRSVAAIAPGVLGQTGIEVSEIIQSIIKKIKPAALIVVDALASMETSRLGTTIQICNTGISPGSGVGNARPGLNQESMGIPVIGIGVPTVVDAQTLARNLLNSDITRYSEKISQKTAPRGELMMVTPREIDLLIERSSKLLAMSINGALQPNFSVDDIMSLVV
ncbi:MAG: GPR endopeptidase [Acutalibacteraceae bacterium]|jgi:spore protease